MTSNGSGETFHAVRAGSRRQEADIYRLYAEMRRVTPLWRSPWGDVYLSSFDLVDQVLASRAVSHALRPGLPDRGRRDTDVSPIAEWLMFMDGADHMLMRRVFQGPFASSDGSLVRRVAAIVDEQMSAVELDCPIDAVAQFTRAIPERVIGGMMGFNQDLLLRAWSGEIRTALDVAWTRSRQGVRVRQPISPTGWGALGAGRPATRSWVSSVSASVNAAGVRRRSKSHNRLCGWKRRFICSAACCSTCPSARRLGSPGQDPSLHLLSSRKRCASKPGQKVTDERSPTSSSQAGTNCNRVIMSCCCSSGQSRSGAVCEPDHIDLASAERMSAGKGLHSCLGRGLAMIEGTAVLRWLVEHVRTIGRTASDPEWIENSSFRGLQRLPITLRR
jgi:cytochrome P450